MPMHVCSGATLLCSFGQTPATLTVPPTNQLVTGSMPAANILDNKPMVNIPPFGMCSSPTNPAVAAATSAAMGVLTPMPCLPAIACPWVTGCPTVLLGSAPALNDTSTLKCDWGGTITVAGAGQESEEIP